VTTPDPAGLVSAAARTVLGSTGPLVVGHRGAPGYRPEHTLASYELAARLGADVVEPDLVSTRDGVLVCRHEPFIGGTTDVATHPEFADRERSVVLGGRSVTSWWVGDFTLAELKALRAVERIPAVRPQNTRYDGLFEVPTFDEMLALWCRLGAELGRPIGICPETKHPTYHRTIGLPLEELLLDTLQRNGLNEPGGLVLVQSFEISNLRDLRRAGLRTQVTQLVAATGAPFDTVANGSGPTYADLLTAAGLRDVARHADGIAPDKLLVVPRAADGRLGDPTPLVADAHRAGLYVHPYTFRAESGFLPKGSSAVGEQLAYLRAGVDGLFTDQPDVGVLARRRV
jgi:glycerophosphoryl diester phosphodiesterase